MRSRTLNFTTGTTADWRRAFPAIGPGTLSLRMGVDGTVNRVRARIDTEAAQDTTGGGSGQPTGLTTDIRSPSVDLAGYALADYRVGRVTLSGGGRYDFVRVPFRNQLRPSDNTTNDYRNISPRLGVNVEVASGASVYASAGRSFRAPAILELGCADPDAACPLPFALGDDPPLRPVRTTTYEVGGQWAPALAHGMLLATLSAYRTNVRDEIFFIASEQALLSGYFTNLDRTRREGVEFGLQGMAARERLSWYGNYAWTRATFQSAAEIFSIRSDDDFAGSPLAGPNDVVPGSQLPLVPDHQIKIGATLHLGEPVSLGVDTRYMGHQWLRGDEANATAPLGAYTVTDTRLSYTRKGWEIAGIMTNVFDTHRATFGTFNENRQTGTLERFLTPVNGRAAKLIVRRALGSSRDNVIEP